MSIELISLKPVGQVELVIVMDTRCSWTFFYNGHFYTDLEQNGMQKEFSMPLGTPSSNLGNPAATFFLTAIKSEDSERKFEIIMTWKQGGEDVEKLVLNYKDVDRGLVPFGPPYKVSQMLSYEVLNNQNA